MRSDVKLCTRCGGALRGDEYEPSNKGANGGHEAAALTCFTCGTKVHPEGGTRLIDNRYEVQAELGNRGIGVVYLAKDLGLQRTVEIKMIVPRSDQHPDWRLRVQNEAIRLAAIRNPYIGQVFAFGTHGEACFYALEHVSGQSLRGILNEHRSHGATVPMHRTLTIVSRLAEGLDVVHAAGLVHCEVTPSNIVIENDTGRPVLVDLGLAAASATPVEDLEDVYSDCLAPEQTWMAPFGSVITPRTDVYALGCVAFEMLSNTRLFEARNRGELVRAHAREKPPALSSVRQDLAPFDAVLSRALAKDPAERFESCPELIGALLSAVSAWHRELASTEPTATPVSGARASTRRVLVVDDDPNFLKFATRAVQLAFYVNLPRITAVDSGSAAIMNAAREPPDLVLLDFDMPGLDGLDTLSRLRALPHGNDARVVVLSGKVGRGERWRFSVLGVSDFVAKPIDLEQLVDSISTIATRAGWQDAREVSASSAD